MKPQPRLLSENVTITCRVTQDGDRQIYPIGVQLGWCPDTLQLLEIAITERGKVGHSLDTLLGDLGLGISRAIQGRCPNTGAEQPESIAADVHRWRQEREAS